MMLFHWSVFDVSAAAGYNTELLARVVGPSSRVYAQNPEQVGRLDERMKKPVMNNVVSVVLRREVEAAGFRFVAEGGFLRNPDDPRDASVFKPKQPNDEFVLKFVKP